MLEQAIQLCLGVIFDLDPAALVAEFDNANPGAESPLQIIRQRPSRWDPGGILPWRRPSWGVRNVSS